MCSVCYLVCASCFPFVSQSLLPPRKAGSDSTFGPWNDDNRPSLVWLSPLPEFLPSPSPFPSPKTVDFHIFLLSLSGGNQVREGNCFWSSSAEISYRCLCP